MDRKPSTYITARFKDQETPGGKIRKLVTNLFYHGGLDTRKLPIFSNSDEKLVGFIDATNARLQIFRVDKEGHIRMADNGKPEKAVLSINLERFVTGHANGAEASKLDVGGGTITGPAAKEIAGMMSRSIEKAKAAKEEKKAATAEAGEQPEKPARRRGPRA